MRSWFLQWQESAAPYVVFEGDSSRGKVLSIPHAGIFCPEERVDLSLLPSEVLLRDVDYMVPLIWLEEAQKRSIPTIVAKVHRYVVDLNRAPILTSDFVQDSSLPMGSGEKKGLFWKETTWGENLFQKRATDFLSLREAQKILEKYHAPYHAWLEAKLREVKDRSGRVVLWDAHSMPSQAAKNHRDFGAFRADIVPGDVEGKSCSRSLREQVVGLCKQFSWACEVNHPYSGGYITQHYGRPALGFEALQIEINRKLYMDERSFELKEEGLRQLQSFVGQLLDL